jgi:hypothetical protein
MLQGNKPFSDVAGYEVHNAAAEAQARETGIHPKLYLFDADGEEGVDP